MARSFPVPHRLPWYGACIIVPMTLGWTPQQILLLVPVIIVIIVFTPPHGQA